MRTIVRMEFGSPIYGTTLPTSDTDYKAIHIPPTRDILLGRAEETIVTSTKEDGRRRNDATDVDFESFSLKKYMWLLLEGQTVSLDMFFAPERFIKETSAEWEVIKSLRASWLHKGVSSFAGYCKAQANRYGIKGSRIAATRAVLEFLCRANPAEKVSTVWPQLELAFSGKEHIEFLLESMRGKSGTPVRMMSVCNKKIQENIKISEAIAIYQKLFDDYGLRALQAERNEGIDWKALMHAVRVCCQAKELLETGYITFPRPEAELLLRIRKGEMPYKQVAELIEQGMEELEVAKDASKLPAEPDRERADELVAEMYRLEIILGDQT